MNKGNSYAHINLDRPVRPRPHRLVPVAIVLVMSILLWIIFAVSVAYFLMTLMLLMTTWLATYGLEEAMGDLIRFLRRLQSLF